MDTMVATLESLAVTMLRRPSQDSLDESVQKILKGVDLHNPLFEGHVFKQKGDNKFINSLNCFNRRYFVLYPGIILYYEHRGEFREDLKFGMVSVIIVTCYAKTNLCMSKTIFAYSYYEWLLHSVYMQMV